MIINELYENQLFINYNENYFQSHEIDLPIAY